MRTYPNRPTPDPQLREEVINQLLKWTNSLEEDLALALYNQRCALPTNNHPKYKYKTATRIVHYIHFNEDTERWNGRINRNNQWLDVEYQTEQQRWLPTHPEQATPTQENP